MDKPTVHYTHGSVFGDRAYLYGVTNHPNHLEGHEVSNDKDRLVCTSKVVSHDADTGRIETRNTIYVKVNA